jgi:multiple sugar transport system ATP-binding protein
MRSEIAALHQRLGTTMVYVTHDQIEAMTLASRIVVLRAGRIEQADRPLDLFNRPANLFVAGFIGAPAMNLFPSRVEDGAAALPGGGRVPVAAPEGAAVTLGLRPQHLRLNGDSGPGLGLRVTLTESLGTETVIHGEPEGSPGTRAVAILPGQARIAPGDGSGLASRESEPAPLRPDGRRLPDPP